MTLPLSIETERQLRQFAEHLSAPKQATVGVAVSGGSDSLAALVLLQDAGWALKVVTVDHGLRPEAAEEAQWVAAFCAARGVPHETLSLTLSKEGGGLQMRARTARYDALRDWAAREHIGNIIVGHTMDDDAETFLMRLSHGSGLDGLSGISREKDISGVTVHRPFLRARREDLQSFLAARGIEWLSDPSNEDELFERVRVRRALKNLSALGLTVVSIAETIDDLAVARDQLSFAARAYFITHGKEADGDIVLPDIFTDNEGKDTERGLRILKFALRWISGADYPPRQMALRDLVARVARGETRTLHGCRVSMDAGLRISREFNAVRAAQSTPAELWDGRWKITGPQEMGLTVRALGDAVKDTPWRNTGLPRETLRATPAIWRGGALIAAPLAGLENGWSASATGRGSFADFLVSR